MKTKAKLTPEQFYRELEAWAKKDGAAPTPLPPERVVIDFLVAKARLTDPGRERVRQ